MASSGLNENVYRFIVESTLLLLNTTNTSTLHTPHHSSPSFPFRGFHQLSSPSSPSSSSAANDPSSSSRRYRSSSSSRSTSISSDMTMLDELNRTLKRRDPLVVAYPPEWVTGIMFPLLLSAGVSTLLYVHLRSARFTVFDRRGQPLSTRWLRAADFLYVFVCIGATLVMTTALCTTQASVVSSPLLTRHQYILSQFSFSSALQALWNAEIYLYAILVAFWGAVFPFLQILGILYYRVICKRPHSRALRALCAMVKFAFLFPFTIVMCVTALDIDGATAIEFTSSYFGYSAAVVLLILTGNFATSGFLQEVPVHYGGDLGAWWADTTSLSSSSSTMADKKRGRTTEHSSSRGREEHSYTTHNTYNNSYHTNHHHQHPPPPDDNDSRSDDRRERRKKGKHLEAEEAYGDTAVRVPIAPSSPNPSQPQHQQHQQHQQHRLISTESYNNNNNDSNTTRSSRHSSSSSPMTQQLLPMHREGTTCGNNRRDEGEDDKEEEEEEEEMVALRDPLSLSSSVGEGRGGTKERGCGYIFTYNSLSECWFRVPG